MAGRRVGLAGEEGEARRGKPPPGSGVRGQPVGPPGIEVGAEIAVARGRRREAGRPAGGRLRGARTGEGGV